MVKAKVSESKGFNNLVTVHPGSSSTRSANINQYVFWKAEKDVIFVKPVFDNVPNIVPVRIEHRPVSKIFELLKYFQLEEIMNIRAFIDKYPFLIGIVDEISRRIIVDFDNTARFSIELYGDIELDSLMITSYVNRNIDDIVTFRNELIEYLIEDKNNSFDLLNVVLIPNEL